jgi:hypothetical protein
MNNKIFTYDHYDTSGVPITSGTIYVKLIRLSDLFIFDWFDNTFKSSGWSNITTTMSNIDTTNLPGKKKVTIDISLLSNGLYELDIPHSTDVVFGGSCIFEVYNGNLLGEVTSNIPSSVWDTVPTAPITNSYGDIVKSKLLTIKKFIGLK